VDDGRNVEDPVEKMSVFRDPLEIPYKGPSKGKENLKIK
jgi:hypothetical protein